MAKFQGRTTQSGGVAAETIAKTPVQMKDEGTPQASPSAVLNSIVESTPILDNTISSVVEAVPRNVPPTTIAQEQVEQQVQQEEIPEIRQRYVGDVDVNPSYGYNSTTNVIEVDKGTTDRARIFAKAFESQAVKIADTQSQLEGAPINVTNRAFNSVNAYNPMDGTLDPKLIKLMPLVTENFMADVLNMDTQGVEDSKFMIEGEEGEIEGDPKSQFSKSDINTSLGKNIAREYNRLFKEQAGETPTVSDEDATVLGDLALETYKSVFDGEMVQEVTEVTRNNRKRKFFKLTSKGQELLAQSAPQRKKMFPKQMVRPTKAPMPGGQLQGDSKTITKRITGAPEAVSGKYDADKAMENLNTIPNVVLKDRLKVVFTTLLPALMDQGGDLQDVFSRINNFGNDKMAKFIGEEKSKRQKGERYSADANMNQLKNKIAQELYAVCLERGGANYLTYYMQAFNGRLAPQQTGFDPTTSKLVRFVTGNAVSVTIKPMSRQEKNIRQMYAMMLVKDADMLLPVERSKALQQATPQLLAWGRRLKELRDGAMTDAELDQIAEAITSGVSMSDPNFPKFKGLALDPELDSDLIKAITKKGEDGPHFIDGLIDFVGYHDTVVKSGKPYQSYFNAYIDGKTNGLASNGIQMGDYNVARATGVLRNQATRLLDEGDIRDNLKSVLLSDIDNGGIDGLVGEYGDLAPTVIDVAKELFSIRNLNKQTTMTFGYGQDIEAFVSKFEEFINTTSVENPEFGAKVQSITNGDPAAQTLLAKTLLKPYGIGLYKVLSEKGIKSRALMRGASTLAAITNNLFSIKSPLGMDLHFGGNVYETYEEASKQNYSIYKDGKRKQLEAVQYRVKEATAASTLTVDGEVQVGRKAINGSVVGPVQSLDAATVIMTVTGKSWDRLTKASNGNPYIHTIYDAFKMDANGYDVMLEEVNNNWLKASMEWSYLEETLKSTEKFMADFNEWFKTVPPEEKLDLSIDGAFRMVGDLTKLVESKEGNLYPQKLMRTLKTTMDLPLGPDREAEASARVKDATKRITQAMTQVGFRFGDDTMTPTQLRAFITALNNEVRLKPRLQKMIAETNADKKQLMKDIKRLGPVYQYYAH